MEVSSIYYEPGAPSTRCEPVRCATVQKAKPSAVLLALPPDIVRQDELPEPLSDRFGFENAVADVEFIGAVVSCTRADREKVVVELRADKDSEIVKIEKPGLGFLSERQDS